MNGKIEAEKVTTAPGEGERQAQRGYVPQYSIAARVIYEALAAGRLQWIGVADRGAGSFDDLVLGLGDRIIAYQIKSRRDPEPFSIKTLLFGSANLLGRMFDSRRNLLGQYADALIETVYACDDYPRTNDSIAEGDGTVSSAAFLRAHEAHRLAWTLADWRNSPFARFISEVQAASGQDDLVFENAWRHTRFLVTGQGRALGLGEYSFADARRLQDLAALLPRLVADPSDKDRWTLAEILSRLSWRDPFGLRHGHMFPVDGLCQSNGPTQAALQQALSSTTAGYTSLVGPPGSGKSTLLASGLLPTPRALIARYLAFVPDEGQGLGRAEAFDFLHDIVTQLKGQNLGVHIFPGTELPELRAQFQALLQEASARFRREGIRAVIVVDGLDHVPREERPQHSFLSELPLPHALPEGIVFVLGTQRLDLAGMPPAAAEQASEPGRCVVVTPLSREAVSRLADAAGVPTDVDRDEIYARSDGHPLSTRYVIEGLLVAGTPDERQEWLRNGPAYGGDVEVFYRRAWRDLEQNSEARRGLAYVALAEGPIAPVSLDKLVGEEATDAASRAAGHLLVRDYRGAWSIFHNSFRLFLREQTGLRHGMADSGAVRRRYGELAAMARDADGNDPQRWMELRYRARADDHSAVAHLAAPERFRNQFIEGRDPGDLQDDINLAFSAARVLRQPKMVVDLILSRHEIGMRSEALGDDVFDALISLGDLRAAMGLLRADGVALTVGKGYALVDAFLAAGQADEARRLFDSLEPISKLLGAEAIDNIRGDDTEFVEWAARALVFREPAQILACLARLHATEDPLDRGFDMENYRTRLKVVVVRGHLNRNPGLPPESLAEALEIPPEYRGVLLYLAAQSAFDSDNDVVAAQRLEAELMVADELDGDLRRESAAIAASVGRLDLAEAFFEGTTPPTIAGLNLVDGARELRRVSRAIITHAALAARLARPAATGAPPESRLLGAYQTRLEMIGRLLGEGRRGHSPSIEPLAEFQAILDFLQRAEGDRAHDSSRWYLDQIMDEAVGAMVVAAAALGQETFARFTEAMDARLAEGAGRLGRSNIRRAYAVAAFRREFDSERAERRLAYEPGLATSPSEELAEAARTASSLSIFGLTDRARAMLAEMHHDGLGYSRPAKKDPQYIVWRDLFTRASEEDPAGRPDRLRFLGRLLAGMTETEGDNAAKRLARAFLNQAAQAGPAWARLAADAIEEMDLATWPDLVEGLLAGVISRRRDLAAAAGVVFGRIVLPFGGEHDHSICSELIRVAPEDQLRSVVQHAVTCLETDGYPARRILLLEEAVQAAADRGFTFGVDVLARWRAELPPPRSGSSPEDPFFLVRTLKGISDVMNQARDAMGHFGAVRAFERIAPRSQYGAAKVLFDSVEALHNDERAVDTLAQAALVAGQRADAETCLTRLKELAAERGSWGDGWRDRVKQRYHRLSVLMNGEPARRAAFDAFVEDLANRREYMGYLLPELADVLELLSPRPTWAQCWMCLERHLWHFREYRIGHDLAPPPNVPDADEHTLADTLFRAIDTTVLELARMVRTAAIELCHTPGGVAVVVALLPRLWQAGGYHAVEAAHIAWECRDTRGIRESVSTFLGEMCGSDDCTVRRIAELLARAWGRSTVAKTGDLPAIYELELPPNPRARQFDPPSGSSPTSSGLYTEDAYSWTWPLETPLKLTASATGLDLANLRARTAQLMNRMGGTTAFGPEAAAKQQRRLGRLNLHCIHRKLLVSAAFQAMRELIGELVAARAIDPDMVPLILHHAATFSTCVRTQPPAPRPAGVPAAEIPDIYVYSSADIAKWAALAEQDPVTPTVPGHVVLAATALHRRPHFQREWSIQEYFGPDTPGAADDLLSQLRCLPQIVVVDGIAPLYPGFAPAGVVRPVPDISGSVDPHMVTLCPRVAARLGWRPDPRHVFTYLDADDKVMAQTIYWRDGVVAPQPADSAVFRYGYVLVVTEDRASDISPYLATDQVSRAWRTAINEEQE